MSHYKFETKLRHQFLIFISSAVVFQPPAVPTPAFRADLPTDNSRVDTECYNPDLIVAAAVALYP